MSDRGERLPSLGDEHEFEAKEIFWKIATEGRILTDAEFAAECKRLEELGWYYDRESKRWARDLQPRSWYSRRLTSEDNAMSDIKAIVRATGTVTYDTPAAAGNDSASVPAPADATQFDRLKDLFDEFRLKYEVLAEGAVVNQDAGVAVFPGERWLITDDGQRYYGSCATFAFATDGQFLRHRIYG
jgi:hypothetical protein